jgi:hypothetical protein
VQDSTLIHAQNLDAVQLELWQTVSNRADAVGHTLENIHNDLPKLVKTLESMMEKFHSSTENLSTMHMELEEQIIRNTEQLFLQQSFISRLKVSSLAELCQYFGLVGFVLLGNSVCPRIVSLTVFLICTCPHVLLRLEYIINIRQSHTESSSQ